jgi:hypothetical protein
MGDTCGNCDTGYHNRCDQEDCDCCGADARASKSKIDWDSLSQDEFLAAIRKGHTPPHFRKERKPDPFGDPDGWPKMESVFRVREDLSQPIQNRPPPGAQPVKPSDWGKLGQTGQSLQQGLDGLKQAGQEMTAYQTPDGQQLAYPKTAAPGKGPMRADTTKGVWTPVTNSSATGATSNVTDQTADQQRGIVKPTTTMK